MLLLVLGMLLIIVGVLSIRFPELVDSLKKNDHGQWMDLGAPPNYAFSKTAGVFSWILNHGYERSQNDEVIRLGEQALRKALFAKYCLLVGAFMIFVGFFYVTFFSHL